MRSCCGSCDRDAGAGGRRERADPGRRRADADRGYVEGVAAVGVRQRHEPVVRRGGRRHRAGRTSRCSARSATSATSRRPSIGAAAQTIAGFLSQTQANVGYSVKQPVTFVVAGVKFIVPTAAASCGRTCWAASAIANVTQDVDVHHRRQRRHQQPRRSTACSSGPTCPARFTKPMIVVGGGAMWPLAAARRRRAVPLRPHPRRGRRHQREPRGHRHRRPLLIAVSESEKHVSPTQTRTAVEIRTPQPGRRADAARRCRPRAPQDRSRRRAGPSSALFEKSPARGVGRARAPQPDVELVTIADRRSLIVVNHDRLQEPAGREHRPAARRPRVPRARCRPRHDRPRTRRHRQPRGSARSKRASGRRCRSCARSCAPGGIDRTLRFHTRSIIVVERLSARPRRAKPVRAAPLTLAWAHASVRTGA